MNKEDVRRLFPEAIAVADEFREVFGNGVKLVYIKEGDRELGKPGNPGVKIDGISGDLKIKKQTK